ncbi:MAG TPA: hypothetical protein VM910_02295 [Bradyrhizobium sp.]|nr:hypothetical protein [Bradyrhizobium sp.]
MSGLIDLFPFQNRARAPLFQPGGFKKMAVIAFTDAQLEQIMTTAAQIPRRLRDAYLQRVVQLLNGRDFGDGDVHRAARAAAGEIMHGTRPVQASR